MQLRLDLDDRPQVRFVYTGTERRAEYLDGIGVQMCCLASLERIGGKDVVS